MKTKFKLGLGLGVALVLGACSADSIDAPISENWPDDFTVAEYARANPDLATYQCIAAVADSNNAYMEVARSKMMDSLIAAAAEKNAPEPVTAKDSSNAKSKVAKFTITVNDEAAVFFDDEASVKAIFTDYAGLDEEWWPGLPALINGVISVDPETGDTTLNPDGARAMEYRAAFKNFHRYGFTATQDLAFLKTVKVDSSLIEKQYIMAGRYEGRPYRFCHDGEANIKKLDVQVEYDTIPNGIKTYVFKDTILLVEAEKSTWKFALSNGDTCVSEQACGKKIEADTSLSIIDTIKPPPTEKQDSIKVDSIFTDKINRKTTMKPMSENAVAPAGNKDRVWDFSADLYCRNEADWEIYLIENP